MADKPQGNTKIAIVVHHLRSGESESAMISLANELAKREIPVDVIICNNEGGTSVEVGDGVEVVLLEKNGAFDASRKIAHYLKKESIRAVICGDDRSTLAVYLARRKISKKPRIISTVFDDLTSVAHLFKSRNKRLSSFKKVPMTFIYPKIDKIVAVSDSVAESASAFIGIPKKDIDVIPSPTDIDAIKAASEERTGLPWLDEGSSDMPVIITVGRLTAHKDLPTLFRAFKKIRSQKKARLIIIGDGLAKDPLDDLAKELGIVDDIRILGFQRNPHKFVAKADLFVLSSTFEGLPTELIEAMVVGTPCVSTDCPGGPTDMLPPESIAPVGDSDALAEVMMRALEAGRQADPPKPKHINRPASFASDYLGILSKLDYLDSQR